MTTKDVKLASLGEFGLIDSLRRTAHVGRGIKLGIGDDTAVLVSRTKGYLLFTTDMLIEGVHFTRRDNPGLIGQKALCASLSDIAAMGGRPDVAVVSLGVPPRLSASYVKKLYAGINRAARRFAVSIAGGDTVKTEKIVINVALLGEVRRKDCILRSGARRGEKIFVTGKLGGSLQSGRHLSFTPRLKESQLLVSRCKPSAMIDISDGLVADLSHICRASRTGAVLFSEQIPVRSGATLKQALYEGEDFELLFTLPEEKERALKRVKGLRCHCIGEITDRRLGLTGIDRNGRKFKFARKGYTHF